MGIILIRIFSNMLYLIGLSVAMNVDQVRQSVRNSGHKKAFPLPTTKTAYMKGEISEKAGIRLVIHDADSLPLVDEFGLDLQPGSAVSMALELVSRREGEGKIVAS